MNAHNPRNPMNAMAQQYLRQQIDQAGPAQQLVMLYDGAIKFSLQAKEAILRKDVQARYNANRRVMEIVAYLLEILDVEKGGEVGQRLQRIYSFLLKRLMDVDFKNDHTVCDEVVEHLRILRDGWDQVAKQGARPAVAPVAAAPAPVVPMVQGSQTAAEPVLPRFNAVA